jgi:hypothetical protein
MAYICSSNFILEHNFLFWKVFPTKISKKGNFDGWYKWSKNHFGKIFPKKEIPVDPQSKKGNFDGLHKLPNFHFKSEISFFGNFDGLCKQVM